jgi:hypothetical protein
VNVGEARQVQEVRLDVHSLRDKAYEAMRVVQEKEELETKPEHCSYREYDSESGEWYGCSLEAHGAKVKHVRGKKLNG